MALSDQMWLRAIGAFMGGGGDGGEEEKERLWLAVHHILPISLQFQTTGPDEMTVGAANCEIN